MKKILAVTLLSLFSGLLSAQMQTDGKMLSVTEVRIAETEPGIGRFVSRLMLSKDFLRLDDGAADGNFTLFNRKTHEIHSFNHEDQSQLVMKPIAQKKIDFKLDFKIDDSEMKDAPSVGGVTPVQHQYYADTRLCKQSVNVQGLLPQMTQALIDYEQALVAQNSQTLERIPAGVRSSCYMANNYLHASDYLKQGFPLFVMDDLGRQKRLQGFQQIEVPASLFEPIAGYKLYYPNAANLDGKTK
jgi:hypothetical protein